MQMIRLAAMALLVSLLVGCATPQPTRWQKAGGGGNQTDLDNDIGQCNAQAFGIAGVTLNQAVIVRQNCMIGKGWRVL